MDSKYMKKLFSRILNFFLPTPSIDGLPLEKKPEKLTETDLREKVLTFLSDKNFDYIVLFPLYQEMLEGYYYDDISRNLNHIYYNSSDSIDASIYNDVNLFIKDVLYLNSIALRNYDLSFHVFKGSYGELVSRIEKIEKLNSDNIRLDKYFKFTPLVKHSEYFEVDELFCLY